MEKKQETPEDIAWNKQYNEEDFSKTIYSFNAVELSRLAPWDAQIQLGHVAEGVLTNIIRNDCLKRVGGKNSPDTGIRYDMQTGQFFIYQPRVWCSMCENRRAEFSYKEKVYCKSCVETLKSTIPPTTEPKKAHPRKKKEASK